MQHKINRWTGYAVLMAAPLGVSADAVRVYDVDDYVQDGLALHFDGIRNAGATADHATDGATWVNIGSLGVAYNATIASSTSDPVNGEWTATGYDFNRKLSSFTNTFAAINTAVDIGKTWTIQLATTIDTKEQAQSQNTGGTPWEYPSYLNTWDGNNANGMWTHNRPGQDPFDQLVGDFSHWTDSFTSGEGIHPSAKMRLVLNSWQGKYVTKMLSAEGHAMFFQGDELPAGAYCTVTKKPDPQRYSWSGAPNLSTNKKTPVRGVYHSVRIYTNTLNAAQVALNRKIDEARFRNEATKGRLPNVVVVGADGTGASEKYCVTGSETFSAPETVVTAKGAFRRYGHVVETWNGATWEGAVTNLSGSCDIDASAAGAAKRITWLWSDILRSYDVDDYVQDGLALHFDGIRNAGATADHATDGATWVNIGSLGSEYNATIESWDATSVNGEWIATGYNFNPSAFNTFAAINAAVDIGSNWTIQIATTVDTAAQTYGYYGDNSTTLQYIYPSYFNTYDGSNANGMWTRNAGVRSKELIGAFNSYFDSFPDGLHASADGGAGRIGIGEWEGKYATLMLSEDGQARFFQDGTLPAAVNCTITKSPGAKRYSWSGSPISTKKTPVRGVYHSVRIYTNALDAAQVALNRKIDEARFRGNCDVTIVNGAIGETGQNGASSFPDGCYNMGDGESWTLTAASIVVDGKRYQPRLTIEMRTGDEWVQSQQFWTESCTVDKTALGSGRIRLTWTWEIKKGLMIVFR